MFSSVVVQSQVLPGVELHEVEGASLVDYPNGGLFRSKLKYVVLSKVGPIVSSAYVL
jgi:hypothetical protein